MAHKFDPRNKQRLDSEERQKMLPAVHILEASGLKSGDIMADIGCGTGYFSLPAAEIVGMKGKVLALDIEQDMLDTVMGRAEEKHLDNIVPLKSEEYHLPLPEDSADFTFLAFILHEIQDILRFLTESKRITRPGGVVAILEWKKVKTTGGPPLEERLEPGEVETALTRAGFAEPEYQDIGEQFYIMKAIK